MCGICGIVAKRGGPVDGDLVGRMADTLSHRGPDDSGVYTGGGAGLGHRRLSVIDLSPRACQPMANEDGMLRVVCNGEINNYRELRSDLEKRGHTFRSGSEFNTTTDFMAAVARPAVRRVPVAQPTTLRENRSRTTAR